MRLKDSRAQNSMSPGGSNTFTIKCVLSLCVFSVQFLAIGASDDEEYTEHKKELLKKLNKKREEFGMEELELTDKFDADIKKRIMKILKRSEEHGDSVCLPHPKNGADEDEWHLVYCQDADDEDDDKGTDAKDLAGDAVDNWLMELKEYTFAGEDHAANTCEKVPSELAPFFGKAEKIGCVYSPNNVNKEKLESETTKDKEEGKKGTKVARKRRDDDDDDDDEEDDFDSKDKTNKEVHILYCVVELKEAPGTHGVFTDKQFEKICDEEDHDLKGCKDAPNVRGCERDEGGDDDDEKEEAKTQDYNNNNGGGGGGGGYDSEYGDDDDDDDDERSGDKKREDTANGTPSNFTHGWLFVTMLPSIYYMLCFYRKTFN